MSATNAKGKGFGIEFLRAHVTYAGDDCVIWPLFIDPHRGYGVLGYLGNLYKAHRLMCELAHGAPSDGHEAAHSCGNGPAGCVNPRHLSWKTRTENQRDRVAHGTAGNGGSGRRRKLKPEQAAAVRASQEGNTVLAERYGVTRSAIRQIRLGKTHMLILNHDRITTALRGMGREMSAKEIAKVTRQKENSIHTTLHRMLKDGEVTRVSPGIYAARTPT